MPNYDYYCGECKKNMEVSHSMNCKAPRCPQCKSGLIKLFTGFRIGSSASERDDSSAAVPLVPVHLAVEHGSLSLKKGKPEFYSQKRVDHAYETGNALPLGPFGTLLRL